MTQVLKRRQSMNVSSINHDTLRLFILNMAKQMISSHLKILRYIRLRTCRCWKDALCTKSQRAGRISVWERTPIPEVSEDLTELCEKVALREVLAETMTPVIAPTYIDHEKGVSRKYPPEMRKP